jgi:hypothetical protein
MTRSYDQDQVCVLRRHRLPHLPFVHVRAADPTEVRPDWSVVGKIEMTEDMTERLVGGEFARIGVRHWTSTSSYSDWFTNQRRGVPLDDR